MVFTPTTAVMGHATQFGTSDSGAIDERFHFDSEDIRKRGVIIERDGLRGTRSHHADDTRVGPYTVGGTVTLQPTPEDLDIWLPRILGAAESTDVFALAETLPDFNVGVDRVTKVFTYAGCKVNKATFRGSSGQTIRLILEIVGKTESVANAGTFPTLSFSNTTPYVFTDLALTLQSSEREVTDFELVIDNQLVTDRFNNSLTVTDIPPGDRIISLRTTHPYASANADLYAQALAGAAGTLALATGGYSTSFAFAKLQVPDESPVVQGKGEIPLTLNMTSRMTGTTKELIVTHDAAA